MTVYLSGPMTGRRNNNRRAFEKAQEKLERVFGTDEGKFRIINPVKIGDAVDQNFEELNKLLLKKRKPEWADYMRADIKRLCDATHLFLLKGWEKSKGALLEIDIAGALDIPCAETIEELKSMEGRESWM